MPAPLSPYSRKKPQPAGAPSLEGVTIRIDSSDEAKRGGIARFGEIREKRTDSALSLSRQIATSTHLKSKQSTVILCCPSSRTKSQASVGLSFLQFINMNCMRNIVITGFSLFLGISIPQFFDDYLPRNGLVRTNAGWFNASVNTIFASSATVGLIIAVFLDNTLEVEKSKKDRGMPWWVKFRTFSGDRRNEEFYNLPFNLNRFFPPT
ncbi:hypothetical protein Droror1_Dr00028039 [Drosera rotundifolia]